MTSIRVLLVQARKDPIASELAERLQTSPRFTLHSGRAWSDRELEKHLGQRLSIEWSLVVLVGTGERNDWLSRSLLSQQPDLVVVRIDVDPAGLARSDTINVDLVQHLKLDQQKLGFERLLRAMHRLVENHGPGDADRLARFLVLDDSADLSGEGVRFLELMPAAKGTVADRKLPAEAIRWINAAIAEYLARYPITEGGQNPFYMNRQRALDLLAELDAEAERETVHVRSERLTAAAHELVRFLNDPAHHAEPLVRLKRRLEIAQEDLQVLLLCLAPEVDLAYQLIFSHIQDDMTRRFATAGLADALMSGHGASTAAASVTGLLAWRLLATDTAQWPGADQPLRIDPALLQWMMVGGDALLADVTIKATMRAEPWRGRHLVTEQADRFEQDYLRDRLLQTEPNSYWTVLTGPDLEGWRAVLEAAALSADTGLVRVSYARFSALEQCAREDAALRITRAARLMALHTVIDCASDVVDPAVLSALVDAHTEQGGACALIADDARIAAMALPPGRWRARSRPIPALSSRAYHFRTALQSLGGASPEGESGVPLSERLAAAYPLGVEGLAAATALAASTLSKGATADEVTRALSIACRRVAAPDVLRLARRLEPTYTLEDLIVPTDRAEQLREIVANVEYGRRVFEDWGFGPALPYGRGIAALFSGPSGTGKTMAAQAIARRLGVDVFAVDLSRISSKYVGETEKHLDAVFCDAERAGAVLLFDEADALFGKRSEVNNANDYYANQTVAFLLQRTEAFAGLAILTTNHRQGLDSAFLRRLRFIVDFPKPDAEARQAIWKRCIPSSAPKADDIDWQLLAWFDLSGGVIRQISVRAAFLAAQEGSDRIFMRHLRAALKSELSKLGMQTAERDLIEYDRLRALERRKLEERPRAA